MRLTSLAFAVLVACSDSTSTSNDSGADDATLDSSGDASKDSSTGDASADAATDTGPSDDGSVTDSGGMDAGDGGACANVTCNKPQVCCNIASSFNYGKCYSAGCLACCQ